jgi:MFS family permease
MLTSLRISHRRALPGGRSFRLLLASLAISSCGDWLYNVALLAAVYARTGSATLVALTTAARVLPVVVVGPLGGVIADRYDRRALMIASDLTRAGLMGALAAVIAVGLPIVLAPVLAALATAAATVQPPSVAASTARLVADAELQRANALRALIGQAAIVTGPVLGALLLLATGPALAILANGLTFIASAAAILAVGRGPAFVPVRQTGTASTRVFDDIRAGARALRAAPTAIRLIAADVLCSMVIGLLTVALVLVSRRVGAGAGGYGILLGGFGAGGILGAMIVGRLDAPSRWRPLLAIGLMLVAAMLIALSAVDSIAAALMLAVIGGAGMIIGEVLADTALPRMVNDETLARAYGLAFPASIAGMATGSLIAGPLIARLGLHGALIAAGLFVLCAATLLLRRPFIPAQSDALPVAAG